MRIASASYMDMLQQGIRDAEGKLGILTQQITSGKRINRPSDDPIGASQALRAHATLEMTLSNQRTLQRAIQLNGALDNTLGDLATPLQTAYNAALKATQPGLGDTGRAACAEEVRTAMQRLVTIGNSEFNGIYLLAGTDNREPPLTETGNPNDVVQYDGDEHPMRISIAPGRTAEITITGQELFNFEDGTGNRPVSAVDDDIFQVMADLARDIEIGYTDGINEHMNELKTLQEHVLVQRGKVGAYGLRLDQNLTMATDGELQSRTILAEIEDVDLVNALLEVQRQTMAYQSALAATAQIAQMPTLFEWL